MVSKFFILIFPFVALDKKTPAINEIYETCFNRTFIYCLLNTDLRGMMVYYSPGKSAQRRLDHG